MSEFLDILDKYFFQMNINSRGKNYIYAKNIKTRDELAELLEIKQKELIYDKSLKTNDGFGLKTLSDLTKFLEYYDNEIKNKYNDKVETKTENKEEALSINSPKETSEESHNTKWNHEGFFKNYVNEYFNLKKITIRSKNAIAGLRITNLNDLQTLLNNKHIIFQIKGYGTKTITDLENLYKFITSSKSFNDIDTKVNINVELQNILNSSSVDNEYLIQACEGKLKIFPLIIKHFDQIFSILSKSFKLILKYNLGLQLTNEEKVKLNSLTKERVRQINKRLLDNNFKSIKLKIEQLLKFSDQDIKFNDNYIFFKEELNKYGIHATTNYKVYLFVYFIINEEYDYFNLNLLERSNKLLDQNNIIFYKRKLGLGEFLNKLNDNIKSICEKKYYTEYKIIEINNETINEKEQIINYIINTNNLNKTIIYDQGILKSKKHPNFVTLISMSIKYYNDLTTVKMIKEYLKERFPNAKFNEAKIRSAILKNKDIFFNLGKTGKYGLVNENYKQITTEHAQGFKSIRLLISEILKNENKPIHMNTIIKSLMGKYKTLNTISLDRIIRDTSDFRSIGQSFFILNNSNLKYTNPINHRKINSLLQKFNIANNLNTNWVKKIVIEEYLIQNKVPNYQIEYILTSEIFVHKNKATSAFEKYISDDIFDILEDENIANVIRRVYSNASISNKIQIRKNIKKYIQLEYHFTILEEDIQRLINFHI
jgi:hypothetical protein